jgi:glycopeptide antibiotics resistance protein
MKRKITATGVIFGIYCLILVWIVLCKTSFSVTEFKMLFGKRNINIIPFLYQDAVSFRFHIREVLLNVLVFIPFGVYLKMFGKPDGKTVLYGFAFSFALELCQFILAVGVSDITDIITNTTGTAIGVCSYVLAGKIFADKAGTDRIINALASAAILIFLTFIMLLVAAN